MIGNKNAQTKQRPSEVAKEILIVSEEVTVHPNEVFIVTKDIKLCKKTVLSKRKKREPTPKDLTQKPNNKRIKISKSEGNS
jgi:hypothetical protein